MWPAALQLEARLSNATAMRLRATLAVSQIVVKPAPPGPVPTAAGVAEVSVRFSVSRRTTLLHALTPQCAY